MVPSTNTPKMTNVNKNNGRPGILHHSEQQNAELMEQIAKIDSKLGDLAKSLSNDTEMTTGSFEFFPGKKDHNYFKNELAKKSYNKNFYECEYFFIHNLLRYSKNLQKSKKEMLQKNQTYSLINVDLLKLIIHMIFLLLIFLLDNNLIFVFLFKIKISMRKIMRPFQ